MGEVIPGECITNTLYENDHTRSLSSSDNSWERLVWERMQELHVMNHAVVSSAATAEPMREEDEEEGVGEATEEGLLFYQRLGT